MMQPDAHVVTDDSANNRSGNSSSDSTPSTNSAETKATTVDDESETEPFSKDEGNPEKSEAQPPDSDDTQQPPSNSEDQASPPENMDTSEPEPLTLKSLKDSMAEITKETKLSFLEYEVPESDIGAKIKRVARWEFDRTATLIAYVDHLEKTVASLKKGKPEVDLERPAGDESLPDGPKKWKLGVKRWKEVPGTFGDPKLLDDEEALDDLMTNDDRSKGNVLISYRIYNKENIHTSTRLEIASPLLLDVLKRVIPSSPVDMIVFQEPYMKIFHNRKKLQEEMSKLEGDSKDHLGLLLTFVKDEWPTANQTLDEIENGIIKEIGYNELWLLYPKGAIVYALEDEEWRAYRVNQSDGFGRLSTGSFSSLRIECIFLQFDSTGHELEAATTSFTVLPFTKSQPIRNLRLMPEKYMPKGAGTREPLVARGQRYWDYRGKGHFQEYIGNAWLTATPNDGLRVMIDYVTSSRKPPSDYDYYEPAPPGSRDTENKEDEVDRLRTSDFDDAERPLYCPAKVLAFSLRDKTWRFVKVSDLRDVKFRDDSFKRLVIKAEHKTVVKAMVRSYLSKEPIFGDLIQGKGRGLVVLLHGAPGTGKTLTAECVAEKENRPLYMVTCGDLGTEPDELENKLSETFEFAVNWNAVLLLDEADVFLQERDVHDLKRNALVSVFLRQLEYFDGVLFLTTNRPGSLDEAFQSRIHITLGLPELQAESQMKVWAIFVKGLKIGEEEKKSILKYVREDIEKNGNLNGRQIRNAVRTAIAIAAQKKEEVSERHVKDVLGIGRDFKVYLEKVNRMNQEQRAAAIGTRVPVTN